MNGWIAFFTFTTIINFAGAIYSAHYHDPLGSVFGAHLMCVSLFCLNHEWRRVHGL